MTWIDRSWGPVPSEAGPAPGQGVRRASRRHPFAAGAIARGTCAGAARRRRGSLAERPAGFGGAALAAAAALVLAGCVLRRPIEARGAEAEPVPAAGAWRPFATSVEGRPLRLRRVGDGPRRVLFLAGIHGDEREGRLAAERLPAAVRERPELASAVTVTIVEDVNPDGSAAEVRGNARGVDLNRNFPAGNFTESPRTGRAPLDQPEAAALHRLISDGDFDLVLVQHSTRDGPFINWDGPAQDLARRFAEVSGWRMVPSDELHATPGSLGSWVGRDLGLPILTIEYRRGEDPETAWQQSEAAILAVLEAAP